MSRVEFVDELPPISTHGRGRPISPHLLEFAAALREHPGAWAKYPSELTISSARVTAHEIKTGAAPAFREGTYEATTRGSALYVRAVRP